jgi:hypothetical protein
MGSIPIRSRHFFCAVTAVLMLVVADTAAAQDPVVPSLPTNALQAADTLDVDGPISPRGAFIRAVAVPGWGHASIGRFTRGAFYFFTETAAGWMMVKTRSRLGAAKAVEELRRDEVTRRLAADGITDPARVGTAQENDEGVAAAMSLVEARSQQFEDWLVFGVFMAFLSGADAFVSAHLRDFPDPVGIQPSPLPGRLDLQLSVPLGGAPRERADPPRP